MMKAQLERILATQGLSKDVYEQVEAYQVIWGTILTPH